MLWTAWRKSLASCGAREPRNGAMSAVGTG